ncbi:MAG: hypothetical protein M4579_000149 [Chaenotheca gracillima]|nr:MAG: hypothetical protein M4579_000149 [Chaenotheca gracillima]
MSRPTTSASRTSTLDSSTSLSSPSQMYASQFKPTSSAYASDQGESMANLSRQTTNESRDQDNSSSVHELPRSAGPSSQSAAPHSASGTHTPSMGVNINPAASTSLSGLVCNVHRTTGKEPHALVGATTTILGDKLYVFGGRILSRTKPQLTADMYELDLIRRHWSKVETKGDIPPPRYFHSVCALGDSKLVCYGGMSPAVLPSGQPTAGGTAPQPSNPQDPQPEVVVMSDIHIYDVRSRSWSLIPTSEVPQGRYAHCATILPSSAAFSSRDAPISALHHNPTSSTGNPNQGSLGVAIDGMGGAEMVVVGGQDSGNHYIEQISVFNLRSLKWTSTDPLEKSCGAYRSVVAPLTDLAVSQIGQGTAEKGDAGSPEKPTSADPAQVGSSMLIYSNYNFLDVKLELQIRAPNGKLTEKPMNGTFSPPGLRFPNGGVIDRNFVVSGTYLTSSKQEYALWALDLRTLTWSRIDAGGNHFSQGSWNRGVLWKRRNAFVVLGNRKRSLVEDYNHRRINFSNICMVELEAFGLYDNPRKSNPMSGFVSASAPHLAHSQNNALGPGGGGRPLLKAAEELGKSSMTFREMADMDLLAMGGERVPVNSRMLARRWGPYFVQLMKEGAASQDNADTATLRPQTVGSGSTQSRNSSITITPSIGASSVSTTSTLTNNNYGATGSHTDHSNSQDQLPHAQNLSPSSRPRTLYLPHTHLTLQTLVVYLYTSALPLPQHPLCTPQILCSLLQLARPYQIDGLLEAVVERLHQVLDGRNAAAVFNAAAMAAGGGEGLNKLPASNRSQLSKLASNAMAAAAASTTSPSSNTHTPSSSRSPHSGDPTGVNSSTTTFDDISDDDGTDDLSSTVRQNLRINTTFRPNHDSASTNANHTGHASDDDDLSSNASTSASTNTTTDSEFEASESGTSSRAPRVGTEREVWGGEISSVVGLQKRGLRGLMEGRRMRERGRSQGAGGMGATSSGGPAGTGNGVGGQASGTATGGPSHGLGIA